MSRQHHEPDAPASPPSGDADAARRLLRALAARWDLPTTSAQIDAILRYSAALLSWSLRINLTAATSLTQLAAEHLPDSFALASRLAETERVVDVGSGGGLPALPLALLREKSSFALVEPTAKKVAFLRHAIRILELQGRVSVHHCRIEGAFPDVDEGAPTARFDVAISRATFSPERWLPIGSKLVRPGGRVFALSSIAKVEPPSELSAQPAFPYQERRFLLEFRRST